MGARVFASTDPKGFFAIEHEMQKRRAQHDSVKGKHEPFRVEFRYRNKCRHYQYFETYEDALKAEDSRCRYNIYGGAVIEYPSSQQVQMIGSRGGWSKYKHEPSK